MFVFGGPDLVLASVLSRGGSVSNVWIMELAATHSLEANTLHLEDDGQNQGQYIPMEKTSAVL